MEELQEELQPVARTCTKCEAVVPEGQKYCSSCGYPENGSIEEKAKFNAEAVMTRSKQREAPSRIRGARNTLFVVGGLMLLGGLVYYFLNDDIASLIAGGVLAIVFLILGFWSQQKPLIAIVLGLLVYLTNIVLAAIVEPSTIARGIIIKVVIIVFLIKGINSALHLRKSQPS